MIICYSSDKKLMHHSCSWVACWASSESTNSQYLQFCPYLHPRIPLVWDFSRCLPCQSSTLIDFCLSNELFHSCSSVSKWCWSKSQTSRLGSFTNLCILGFFSLWFLVSGLIVDVTDISTLRGIPTQLQTFHSWMNPPLLRRLGLAIAFQLFFYI